VPGRGSRSAFAACAAALAVGGLAGCGNARGRAPDITVPARPAKFATHAFPAAGVTFGYPANWSLQAGTAQYLVATVGSGRAAVAIWRFVRTEPLPANRKAIEAARSNLLKMIRVRDRRARVHSAKLLFIAKAPAIELRAREHIAGQLREVRSAHIYFADAEIVVDMYAPAAQFASVDRTVFRPLLRSLRLRVPPLPKSARKPGRATKKK
jgi:hypothetical protein